MSYTKSIHIQATTGLTLRGQLVNSAGADSGGVISSGFAEIGSGHYMLVATIPDGHVGGLKVYENGAPETILHFEPIDVPVADVVAVGANTTAATAFKNMLANTGNGTTLYANIKGIVMGGNVGSLHGVTEGDGMQLSYVDEVGVVDGGVTLADTQSGTWAAAVMTSLAGIPAAVWAVGTRTLTSLGTVVADSAAAVWAYASRRLTQTLSEVAATYSASTLPPLKIGATYRHTVTGLGDISTRDRLWLTLKSSVGDGDEDAMVQIEETDGLLYLAGGSLPTGITSAYGSIEVLDEVGGDIAIYIDEEALAHLPVKNHVVGDLAWRVEGTAPQDNDKNILAEVSTSIRRAVTRRTS